MLAQAEHDIYASAVLVTTSREIAKKTSEQLEKQLDRLETRKTAELSLKDYGAIIIAKSMNEAVKIANDFAPEHLEIIARDENILRKIENVGAVFIGPYSCESAGDYASGPSHVLPTGGFAMARAGLNVMDFIKMPSVQVLSKEGLRKIKDSIISLAEGEGLKAHAESVRKRFEND